LSLQQKADDAKKKLAILRQEIMEMEQLIHDVFSSRKAGVEYVDFGTEEKQKVIDFYQSQKTRWAQLISQLP